jgi:hypothetical protein
VQFSHFIPAPEKNEHDEADIQAEIPRTAMITVRNGKGQSIWSENRLPIVKF